MAEALAMGPLEPSRKAARTRQTAGSAHRATHPNTELGPGAIRFNTRRPAARTVPPRRIEGFNCTTSLAQHRCRSRIHSREHSAGDEQQPDDAPAARDGAGVLAAGAGPYKPSAPPDSWPRWIRIPLIARQSRRWHRQAPSARLQRARRPAPGRPARQLPRTLLTHSGSAPDLRRANTAEGRRAAPSNRLRGDVTAPPRRVANAEAWIGPGRAGPTCNRWPSK